LTFGELRHQHDLSIWKLERVVMRGRPLQIDLTEAREAISDLIALQRVPPHSICIECDFGAGKQAHGDAQLRFGGEAACD
jgi:hypothetical protein